MMIVCDTAHSHCVLDNEGYRQTLSMLILTALPLPQWLRERACYVTRTLPFLLLQDFGITDVDGTIINYIFLEKCGLR
jgi:hypothetical protein